MSAEAAVCPHVKSCRMYEIFKLAGTVQIWKDNYCSRDYRKCARYIQSAAGQPIADNLLPNGRLLRKA